MADGNLQADEARGAKELGRVATEAAQASCAETHNVGPMEAHDSAADRLSARLGQAHAMVTMIMTEEGLEAFATLNDRLQTNYLWALKGLISAAIVDAPLAIEDARQG